MTLNASKTHTASICSHFFEIQFDSIILLHHNHKMKLSLKDGRKQVIDPTGLSWFELALLKKQDAFMYYSIPGNRDKKLPGEDIDLSGLGLSPGKGKVSRSFTAGTVKKDPLLNTNDIRHSFTTSNARRGSGSQSTLQCPFTIQEEAGKKDESNETFRHRMPSEADDVNGNLVERKSVVSFETYGDIMLDDIIDEFAHLQPQAQRRMSSSSINSGELRRGSVLQDILFNSIAQMGNLEDFDFDEDSDSD